MYEIVYGPGWELYGVDYGLYMAWMYMGLHMTWLGHTSGTGRDEYDEVYGYDSYVHGAMYDP